MFRSGSNEHPIEPNAVSAAQEQLLPGSLQPEADRILESLCDPSRLKIVQALRATPLTVSEIARVIGKSRAATSKHLRVLRTVDAVRPERRGQYVRYALSERASADVLEGVANAFDQLRPTGS